MAESFLSSFRFHHFIHIPVAKLRGETLDAIAPPSSEKLLFFLNTNVFRIIYAELWIISTRDAFAAEKIALNGR